MMHEAADPVAVEDKGWQEALEAIYPLKINEFRVTDGTLTYVDDDPKRPLHVSRAYFLATNIRNVESPDRTYPSPIHLDAVVFERGRLESTGTPTFSPFHMPACRPTSTCATFRSIVSSRSPSMRICTSAKEHWASSWQRSNTRPRSKTFTYGGFASTRC
jgi:hypothetical protein